MRVETILRMPNASLGTIAAVVEMFEALPGGFAFRAESYCAGIIDNTAL